MDRDQCLDGRSRGVVLSPRRPTRSPAASRNSRSPRVSSNDVRSECLEPDLAKVLTFDEDPILIPIAQELASGRETVELPCVCGQGAVEEPTSCDTSGRGKSTHDFRREGEVLADCLDHGNTESSQPPKRERRLAISRRPVRHVEPERAGDVRRGWPGHRGGRCRRRHARRSGEQTSAPRDSGDRSPQASSVRIGMRHGTSPRRGRRQSGRGGPVTRSPRPPSTRSRHGTSPPAAR